MKQRDRKTRGSGFTWPIKENIWLHSFFFFFFNIGASLYTTISETFKAFRPEYLKRDQTLKNITLSKTTS